MDSSPGPPWRIRRITRTCAHLQRVRQDAASTGRPDGVVLESVTTPSCHRRAIAQTGPRSLSLSRISCRRRSRVAARSGCRRRSITAVASQPPLAEPGDPGVDTTPSGVSTERLFARRTHHCPGRRNLLVLINPEGFMADRSSSTDVTHRVPCHAVPPPRTERGGRVDARR